MVKINKQSNRIFYSNVFFPLNQKRVKGVITMLLQTKKIKIKSKH